MVVGIMGMRMNLHEECGWINVWWSTRDNTSRQLDGATAIRFVNLSTKVYVGRSGS